VHKSAFCTSGNFSSLEAFPCLNNLQGTFLYSAPGWQNNTLISLLQTQSKPWVIATSDGHTLATSDAVLILQLTHPLHQDANKLQWLGVT